MTNFYTQENRIVLQDPEPFARLSELGDSSVNITTRLWVKAVDYWDVYFDTHGSRLRTI